MQQISFVLISNYDQINDFKVICGVVISTRKFEILYYHLIQKDPELARFFAIQTHLTTIYDQATTFHHMLHIFQA